MLRGDGPGPARQWSADAVVVGVLAFALGVAAAFRPSLWVDEAATLSAATRPVDALWTLVHHVDAVHGFYYLLLRGWFEIVPVTEFWARVPSALMVGVAAAGTCVLGSRLSGRKVGIAAGVVFAVLPRTTWAAVEARPYALSMACAVWLTVLFVAAVRRGGRRWWLGYGAALVGAVTVNVMVVLILAGHAAMLAATRPDRRTVRAWLVTVIVASVALIPLFVVLLSQQAQIAWIWPVGPVTLGQIAGEQYFPSVYSDSVRAVGPDQQQFSAEQLRVAMSAWARVAPLIVVIVIVAALAVRARRRHGALIENPSGTRVLVLGAVAWIVVATVVLLGYSVLVRPLYQPHYLTFTTPALALLIGLCVVTLCRDDTRRLTATLTVLAVAAAPNYLAQRGPYAKYGSDYSQVAELLARESGPRDCVVVDDRTAPSVPHAIEGARRAHPVAARDLGLAPPERTALFSARDPLGVRADDLRTCAVLWTIGDAAPGSPADAPVDRVARAQGFVPAERWRFNQTEVVRSVPAGARS